MNPGDYLSDDGQVVLLLCSSLSLRENDSGPAAPPFKLAEWNQLARKIQNSPLKRPASLPGQTAKALVTSLAITPEEAERILRLLEGAGRLALHLENLFARGMWALTRADDLYPQKLRHTLKHQAPSVLFGSGNVELLRAPSVAVIGSRDLDERGAAFAKAIGRKAVRAGLHVVSGGARGSDRLAMEGAIESDGVAAGILADSLERTIRQPDLRQLLLEDKLVLLTPYVPTAGFSVGAAMGRNKVIYGLADQAVVVSSDFQTGGTWAGAVEALKAGWCPVFVRAAESVPKGNSELLTLGAGALKESELDSIEDLSAWLRQHRPPQGAQLDLLSLTQAGTEE